MAAQSATKAKQKKLAYAGVSLDIPAKLPASYTLDMMIVSRGGDNAADSALHAIESVIGDEGLIKVRDALVEQSSEDGGQTEFGELIEAINIAYGLDTGE